MGYTKPSFTHDCASCTFLDSHLDHDLYVCFSEATKSFTYIARYASEPEAYVSLPARIVKTLPEDDILKAALDAHVALLARVMDDHAGFSLAMEEVL